MYQHPRTSYFVVILNLFSLHICVHSYNNHFYKSIQKPVPVVIPRTMKMSNSGSDTSSAASSSSSVLRDVNIKMLSDKLNELIFTNKGQTAGNRAELFAANATRKLTDPFIYTHLYLAVSMVFCVFYSNFELFLITLTTTTLSILYHHKYERAGVISKLEGFFAKIMFLYGFFQIFYAPGLLWTVFEIMLMLTVVVSFLVTNLDHKLYDKYHNFGLHLTPAVWAAIVAWKHNPFVF